MNACFVFNDPSIEEEFASLSSQEGMIGIKGHRSAGGFRVSLYNALPISSVKALTDLMKYFEQKKG